MVAESLQETKAKVGLPKEGAGGRCWSLRQGRRQWKLEEVVLSGTRIWNCLLKHMWFWGEHTCKVLSNRLSIVLFLFLNHWETIACSTHHGNPAHNDLHLLHIDHCILFYSFFFFSLDNWNKISSTGLPFLWCHTKSHFFKNLNTKVSSCRTLLGLWIITAKASVCYWSFNTVVGLGWLVKLTLKYALLRSVRFVCQHISCQMLLP